MTPAAKPDVETTTVKERWRQFVMRAGIAGLSLLVLAGLLLTDIAPAVRAAEPPRDRARRERNADDGNDSRDGAPRAARSDVGTEIIGGEPVPQGTYPFAASISYASNTFDHRCTGSLVTPRHVVTAAHCVNPADDPSDYTLTIGLANRANPPAANIFQAEAIFQHPGWDQPSVSPDVAVLRLDRAVPTSVAQPVAMVARNDTRFDRPGQRAIAAGWGFTSSPGSASDSLMQMSTTIISDAACDEAGLADIDGVSVLCTKVPAKSTCVGDSGGPLFVLPGEGTARQQGNTKPAQGVSAEGKHRKNKKRKQHRRKKNRKQQDRKKEKQRERQRRKREKQREQRERRERRRQHENTPPTPPGPDTILLIGVTSFGRGGCPAGDVNGFAQLRSPVVHDFVMQAINDTGD